MNANAFDARLAPTVCFGAVAHERRGEARNRFVYPLAFVRVPLSAWNTLAVPLFGVDRAAPFTLRAADHGPRDGSALLPWIRGLLDVHGLGAACDGEIVLQTMPRMFGYAFNPVSFWFCHDHDGRLRAVLAEVNNTFGEHHNYLVHHADLCPIGDDDVLRARKMFHVSPFFAVQGEYRFRFVTRGTTHTVHIDYWDGATCRLATRIGGCAEPLAGAALVRWLLRFPFMTVGVVARIHWQALRLWRKRVRFHRKPLPPLEETTR